MFWPGEFHGLYSPWGRKESDTTEQLSLHSPEIRKLGRGARTPSPPPSLGRPSPAHTWILRRDADCRFPVSRSGRERNFYCLKASLPRPPHPPPQFVVICMAAAGKARDVALESRPFLQGHLRVADERTAGTECRRVGGRSTQAHHAPEMPRLPPGAFTLTGPLSGLDLNSGRRSAWQTPHPPLCARQLMRQPQRGPCLPPPPAPWVPPTRSRGGPARSHTDSTPTSMPSWMCSESPSGD